MEKRSKHLNERVFPKRPDFRHKFIKCVLPGCGRTRASNPELSFFSFPKDPDQCKAWLALCTDPELLKARPKKICSLHFDSKHFFNKCSRLRPGAIPNTEIHITMVKATKPQKGKKQHVVHGRLMQMHNPTKKTPVEFYLDVMVEKPKPADSERGDLHSYAEQPDPSTEWDANKENDSERALPPSPLPSVENRGPQVHVGRLGKRGVGPGRPSAQSRAARALPAAAKSSTQEQLSLKLPAGELTQYLVDLRAKQQQISELQGNYSSLLAKVQFRNAHPDWSDQIPEPSLDSPLLTLRDDQKERDPLLERVDLLSRETLLPLSPDEAWHAVVALRKQVLDLQVALMYSRIQVKYRELRLQEVTAEHRRYKATVRDKQRKADKEEQNRDMRIQQLERRCNLASSTCSQWRLKTKMAEKTGNKKKRRSELLAKGLEQIFTPMQLRVIRTGKKPRWTEEDIRRAIELKKLVTRRGYAFIRTTMKIPLPSPMIMKRGASRFETLKPLYEQMVAANLLKYSTKKKPKVTKKEDHAYEVEMHDPDLEVDTHVQKKVLTAEDASAESPAAEPAQRKPVRRRKKRPAAQAPLDVEFGTMGEVEQEFTSNPSAGAAASRKRPRAGWSDTRPSWEVGRLWGAHVDQTMAEYEQTRVERRPRQRPTWSADTADFL